MFVKSKRDKINLRDATARFLRADTGATAIEYALVAGFISIAIVTVLGSISTNLRTNFFDLVAAAF